jgi:hypothetical protein
MSPDTAGPIHFLNVEYFFRLLYDASLRIHAGNFQTDLVALLAHFWIAVSVFSFLLSAGILAVFIYSTLRYRQIIADDAPRYATIHDAAHAEEETEHHRWKHVMELIESPTDSDWRQAIIEADIILDDALTHDGYVGQSVGEKLKAVDGRTVWLQEAWEAHKVRNDIAHRGSAYVLTDHHAYRAIQRYETVLRALGEIV